MDRPDGWRRAVEFVAKSDFTGDVYEFGCFRGTSLSHLFNAARDFEAATGRRCLDRFFAFDSFEGMPVGGPLDQLEGYDLALGTMKPGGYAASDADFHNALQEAGVDLGRVTTIKGFYEQSLLRPETELLTAQSRCALLHIDCDFEVSTRQALAFMTPRLQDGCVVLFDDWFLFRGRPDRGVQAAFSSWLATSGYTASSYFTYSWVSAAFILHKT
jgi:O-methyltransferase